MSAATRVPLAQAKASPGSQPVGRHRFAGKGPTDSYEREADHLADAAIASGSALTSRNNTRLGGAITGPSTLRQTINSPGRPIDPEMRGFVEARFGHDFSKVRI